MNGDPLGELEVCWAFMGAIAPTTSHQYHSCGLFMTKQLLLGGKNQYIPRSLYNKFTFMNVIADIRQHVID